MVFDGITLKAVEQELISKIEKCHIDRVYQPRNYLLSIRFRQKKHLQNLLISTHPLRHGIYIAEKKIDNPQFPPTFCMALRKHLEGGKINSIHQKGFERQLIITVENNDELGNKVDKKLVCEIIGKHSNIILINTNNIIIDAINRYSYSLNQYRQVLPGYPYLDPPKQNKIEPILIDENIFKERLLDENLDLTAWKGILNFIKGFSPVICKEIVFKAGLNVNNTVIDNCGEYELIKLYKSFIAVRNTIEKNDFKPIIAKTKNNFELFYSIDLDQYSSENKIFFTNISEAIESFFNYKEKEELFKSITKNLENIIINKLNSSQKKEKLQRKSLKQSKEAKKYRLFGELLFANLHSINKGMAEVLLHNYYSDKTEKIKLRADLTPAENAQRYFKKYNKAVRGMKKTALQLNKTLQEIKYLETCLFNLQNIQTLEEAQGLREELINSGYIKKEISVHSSTKKSKTKPSYISRISSDGYTMLIGKSNTSNDYITMNLADDDDIWLHVKDHPGSHVIIRTEKKSVPNTTLIEAAVLAASYSKAKDSANVPVDYTFKKNIKKPKRAKPGMVIYDNHNTLFVTPK